MDLSELEIDWTFPNANTSYGTHGLHKYPARMIPQIPAEILHHLRQTGEIKNGDTLYDPFVGSGTSMVEARLNNLNSIGNDINPFACMLSETKSKRVDPESVREAWYSNRGSLNDRVTRTAEDFEENNESNLPEKPEVRDGWFPEKQLYQLAMIRDFCDKIEEKYSEPVARVFRISLSETTRYTSYQRNGEFKRYRMAEEDREEHNPNVWELFTESMEDKITRVSAFWSMTSGDHETEILQADSRSISNELDEDMADVVITSPPYGDHKTTVAYGGFSQDPAIVSSGFEYDTMREVDKNGLGGKNNALTELGELKNVSSALDETVQTLSDKDGRDEDAVNFFRDYYEVMKEVDKVVKPGQPIIWVVANRTMSRVNIPTNLITKQLCEHLGMEFVANIPREIPNKTMPLQNAPENVQGMEGDLMSNENIVVMRSSD